MRSGVSIAIDGPAGAGKSTISRELALRLGYELLDTGAMYRSYALCLIEAGRPENARWLDELSKHDFSSIWDGGASRSFCDGRDISAEIRSPEVTSFVSEVAAVAAIREKAVLSQRSYVDKATSQGRGVILEGRDIGTTVLPTADVKVFLTADAQARARRRALEIGADPLSTEQELLKRDAADSSREVSPLRPAPDAVVVDATHLSIDQVVERISEIISEAVRRRPESAREDQGTQGDGSDG